MRFLCWWTEEHAAVVEDQTKAAPILAPSHRQAAVEFYRKSRRGPGEFSVSVMVEKRPLFPAAVHVCALHAKPGHPYCAPAAAPIE